VRVDTLARFEHDNVDTGRTEHVRDGAATGTEADYDDNLFIVVREVAQVRTSSCVTTSVSGSQSRSFIAARKPASLQP
jgi:hypothetical protein